MSIEIVNQIIETSGLILSPLLAISVTYYFAKKLLKYKDNIDREIKLLKDVLYYRALIVKYKDKIEGHENKNYYNTFRNEVTADLGYTTSQFSSPAQIEKRLEYLHELNDKIALNIPKINI